jgi:L-fuconolactonase
MKIDSHQHFWHFNVEDYGWMNDEMTSVKRDFLPADLAPELKNIGFDGSIAVQARQSPEETNWLLDLASRNDFIRGVVGWVDLRSDKVVQQLEAFAKHPKAVGVRHVVHDEPNDDFVLGADFVHGVKQLEKFNLTYDILVFPDHLPNTIRFVEQLSSQQTLIVDHIAKPLIKAQKLSPWKEDIARLAQHRNVYCKLSGMVTEANWKSWKPSDLKPYLDTVFDAFGADRVMIGSDWPVCKVAGDYQTVMGVVIEYVSTLSETEKTAVLGGNAVKAYRLKTQ